MLPYSQTEVANRSVEWQDSVFSWGLDGQVEAALTAERGLANHEVG